MNKYFCIIFFASAFFNNGLGQFLGGSGDGFSSDIVSQSSCPLITPGYVFNGGAGDGFAKAAVIQSSCGLTTPEYVFYGGLADGFSKGTAVQSNCALLTPEYVFYGGQADGFTYAVLQQTVCPNNTPLPIELINFDVACNENQLLFKWATASEKNNQFFTIEKSEDMINWQYLAKISGSRNSTVKLEYSYQAAAQKGLKYYRLRQTDYSGSSKLSQIVTLDCGNDEAGSLTVYPNPARENINIRFSKSLQIKTVVMIDALGQVVASLMPGEETNINLSLAGFVNGVYDLQLVDLNDKITNVKMIVIK